jgi:hypothetical protein
MSRIFLSLLITITDIQQNVPPTSYNFYIELNIVAQKWWIFIHLDSKKNWQQISKLISKGPLKVPQHKSTSASQPQQKKKKNV